MLVWLLTVVLMAALGAYGYRASFRKAVEWARVEGVASSTPDYYGMHSLLLMFVPPLLLTLALSALERMVGIQLSTPVLSVLWVLVPALLLWPALRCVKPSIRARGRADAVIHFLLQGAAFISIATTVGIACSVIIAAYRFFLQVDPLEFYTETTWAPGGAFLESAGRAGEPASEPRFGAVPLFLGTLMVSVIAMIVALPVGMLSAIFLSEYASASARRVFKPVLQIISSVPTVVYGFFAALTVTPLIASVCSQVGIKVSSGNALAPGVVIGMMIAPLMCSLCDDVLQSVPRRLRQASLSLGATKSEMILDILLPAAFPGIVAAFLMAISRAIGETMIVFMAASMSANFSSSPLDPTTTMTVQMVSSLTADSTYDNPQTLSAFGLGFSLLAVTLSLNITSAIILRTSRARYEFEAAR